ncbi:MAG: ISAs1 family transposase [Gammaproteobacteria bacterium]|jgi:predicted transposase YbfD/YdcC|nr:ISAs1 family transposase [Gammaproteobacteria bacterium]
MELSSDFLKHFEPLKDPRKKNYNHRHPLISILVTTLLGTICGAEGWTEIVDFARAKQEWLKTFLPLSHGIPSHDTFGRVFSLLNPKTFFTCFSHWMSALELPCSQEVIALDGKTLRGSHHRKKGRNPLHLVSAWATSRRLLLGQIKTNDKSNEITALPELLKMIDIKGNIVTIDAMGCQQTIAKTILRGEGDYVLAVKDNQPQLRKDIGSVFAKGIGCQFKKMLHRRVRKSNHGHGRVETRIYTLISAREQEEFRSRWPGLQGLGRVDSMRNVDNKIEREVRYYVTSLNYEKVDDFVRAVRGHWSVENNLHWSLDVSFKEDSSRVRIGHAAENLGTVRRMALSLLQKEKTRKTGIAAARKRAGWDHDFLMRVFTTNPLTE